MKICTFVLWPNRRRDKEMKRSWDKDKKGNGWFKGWSHIFRRIGGTCSMNRGTAVFWNVLYMNEWMFWSVIDLICIWLLWFWGERRLPRWFCSFSSPSAKGLPCASPSRPGDGTTFTDYLLFPTSPGHTLFTHSWIPRSPVTSIRWLVLLIHGLNEHRFFLFLILFLFFFSSLLFSSLQYILQQWQIYSFCKSPQC